MFHVGKIYLSKRGKAVKIMSVKHFGTSYHCVKGSDNKWRYARPSDAGRVTASAFDMSCLDNLIVGSEQPDDTNVTYRSQTLHKLRNKLRMVLERIMLKSSLGRIRIIRSLR